MTGGKKSIVNKLNGTKILNKCFICEAIDKFLLAMV